MYRVAKGGKPDNGRQTQSCVKNSLCCPAGEKNSDERWRPTDDGAVQFDDPSAPGHDMEVESGAKRERSGVNG